MNIYGFMIIIVITISVVMIIGYLTDVFPFPYRFIDLINMLYPQFHPPQPPQPPEPTQPPQPKPPESSQPKPS